MSTYLERETKMFNKLPSNLANVFKFDSIHLEKVAEISQYSILAFFIALVGSSYLNGMMNKTRIRLRSIETSELVAKITAYTLAVVLMAKYIPKLVKTIPFIGWWDSHYKPNWHGEATYGISTAMGLAFYTVLYNYYAMVEEIAYRLFPKMYPLSGPAVQICKKKDGTYTQAYAACKPLGFEQVQHDID